MALSEPRTPDEPHAARCPNLHSAGFWRNRYDDPAEEFCAQREHSLTAAVVEYQGKIGTRPRDRRPENGLAHGPLKLAGIAGFDNDDSACLRLTKRSHPPVAVSPFPERRGL